MPPPALAAGSWKSSFAWLLVIGGLLKIAYDLTLLAMFRRVRPPEERARIEALPTADSTGE